MSSHSELWSLREDVRVETEPGDDVVWLRGDWGEVSVRQPSGHVLEALHRMCLGPISLDNVVSGLPDDRGAGLARLRRVLDQLQPLIIRSLGTETGQSLLSVEPITPRSRFQPAPPRPAALVRLSSFAQLRTDGNAVVVESPLALHRVLLDRPEAAHLIGALARFVTAAEAAAATGLDTALVAAALGYLTGAGMMTTPAGGADRDPSLACWSPGDLMFHTRSTLGRHDHDFGGTYPGGSRHCPEPVVKPRRTAAAIPLHRPGWGELRSGDPSLTVAIEARRSVREQSTDPVSAAELGDLLYRSARVRSLIAASADGEPVLSDRPYPGGGARYELELYVTVGQCAGLTAGVYHYDPLGHQLEPVDSDAAAVGELLECARLATGTQRRPCVLITITARFGRVSWKYQGLPYALVLMDAGALIQTLYLVCTAMRLAPCAIGSVRADIVARACGTDWRAEPGVAQFVMGRPPEAPAANAAFRRPVNDPGWHEAASAVLTSAPGAAHMGGWNG